MDISRQVRRSEQRKKQKEKARLIKKLQLSDFTYVADDNNMTFSAAGLQIIDFMNIIKLPEFFKEHVTIDKRDSKFSPEKLSLFCILQNILGYDRIENTRPLNQDAILKRKLRIGNYPDPETFRDELKRYSIENIGQLFLVNQGLLDIMCQLSAPQYVDLHFDSKVITVYGDQENAQKGYNHNKHGRKSYHLKICTIEPFGFILAISLESGNNVSSTDFVTFYEKSVAAVPSKHFVIKTIRLDSGFFSEENIEAFEADYVFFEVVAKKYGTIKQWIEEHIPEKDYIPFNPQETIHGASFSFCFDKWKTARDFVVIRKEITHEKNGQGLLFPKYSYQIICHNQLDMGPKQAWQDYNKRSRIELNIRDLDYDHFITKVPTGNFLSNFAYFWHSVLAYNLMLIFKTFVLPQQWKKGKSSTLRKNLINIPGRLVNRSGNMIMRLMAHFSYADVLNSIKEQLLWLYWKLNPLPA